MAVRTNKTTRLAMLRAIRAWVREDTPQALFEPSVLTACTSNTNIVDLEALTAALAESAAKFLIAFHLDAAGPIPTEAEYRTARQDAEAWLGRADTRRHGTVT